MLEKYLDFKNYTEGIANESGMTLGQFYKRIRSDAKFRKYKSAARSEIQSFYNKAVRYFDIPGIPVYLSDKYKITWRGATWYGKARPKSIVIFPLKAKRFLRFKDKICNLFECLDENDFFNTFIHETAHVLELKLRKCTGHGVFFKKCQKDVFDYFKNGSAVSVVASSVKKTSREGCFIATALYGSAMSEEVKVLSSFRDGYLSKLFIGRVFIKCYYKHSPFWAKKIKPDSFIAGYLRCIITVIVLIIKRFAFNKGE
ncbi:MAG: hypothetical protein PHP69_00180 [Candidatus Omnitrophica bacterium]|nr:hypothetical protein [Candidatus Omnitrophota bacterium]MDD5080777.1 hypothetical protein [Candidatus Omnitrophota bacterium]